MQKKMGAGRILVRATVGTFRNFGVVLLAIGMWGVAMTICDKALYGSLGVSEGVFNQADTVRVILSMTGLAMGLEVVFGPVVAALAVYVGRITAAGHAGESLASEPSVYGAMNFAMNRYSRLFIPHAVAWLSIQIGMIIIVPGILFLLQYAFVDAVACTEKESGPLSRSKRLTRGRRRTLFLLVLPWLILSQGVGFFQLWAMSQATWILLVGNVAMSLIIFVMYVAFYLVYDERTRRKRAMAKG